MRIYIANLGKYNEGELVGAWFTPPVDFEEVKERIGLNDEYEEYAIHDYELPFELTNIPPLRKSTACVNGGGLTGVHSGGTIRAAILFWQYRRTL